MKTEEQCDIALEDAVCLPLEWLQVLACAPTSQLALSTTTVLQTTGSAARCAVLRLLQQRRLWCHTV